VGKISRHVKATSILTSTTTFFNTTWAAILAGAGAMGRVCKIAFSRRTMTRTRDGPGVRSQTPSQTDAKSEARTHSGARPQGKAPGDLNPIEGSHGCFRGDANEIGCTPGLMSVGTSLGRHPELIHGYAPPEICGTLLKWRHATRHVGLSSLGVVIPFPQEVTRGKNFNNRPGTQTGDGGVGSHSIWLQSDGED